VVKYFAANPARVETRLATSDSKLSEACRAKLASPIPGDRESRSYAGVIVDNGALQALEGAIELLRNSQTARKEGRARWKPPPSRVA
jgi:hypothetical protein